MPKTNNFARAMLEAFLANSVATTDTPAAAANVVDTLILKHGTPGTLYVSLHTASPGLTGSQNTNEIAYTGYARIALTRGAASIWDFAVDAEGATAQNDDAVTFGKMTAGAGGIARFWGIGTASSGAGVLLWWGPLALETAKPFTVTDLPTDASSANNDIICNQSYAAGDQVIFLDVPGAALPAATPALADTYFYVIAAGLNTEKFRVSTTSGGSSIDITGEGSGYVAKVLEKNITLNDEPKIDANAMTILER